MRTDNVIMKGRLFGAPYKAIDLWEFRRELTLIKQLIKISEKCVSEKETRASNTFDGVCFYIARSIINYSKAAFDNIVLGHFDVTEMIARTMIENRVILDLIFNDEEQYLWKYYLVHSHRNSFKQLDDKIVRQDSFFELCQELKIEPEFLEKPSEAKPYIDKPYGWTYKLNTIPKDEKFTFKGLCSAVGEEQHNYKDFQWMSKSSHGTSYFEKVAGHNGVSFIMSLISSIYINLYLLVTMYCDGIWEKDFDAVTDEIEMIFHRYFEVYDQIWE